MPVYFVTGKLGSGKSLCAVGKIKDYLDAGRRVATNLNLYLEELLPSSDKQIVTRLPDKPTIFDLESIGCGTESYDEDQHGLIVLDECGTWFNSRGWADKSRQPVIDWFLHARKLGWDIIFIVQNISIMDKQARDTLCEYLVICKRLDRLRFGPFKLPKIHSARVIYGDSPTDPKVQRWMYQAKNLYTAYDTKQVFVSPDMPSAVGLHSVLSAWHLKGRYETKQPSLFQLSFGLFKIFCFSVARLVEHFTAAPAAQQQALPVAARPPLIGFSKAPSSESIKPDW